VTLKASVRKDRGFRIPPLPLSLTCKNATVARSRLVGSSQRLQFRLQFGPSDGVGGPSGVCHSSPPTRAATSCRTADVMC